MLSRLPIGIAVRPAAGNSERNPTIRSDLILLARTEPYIFWCCVKAQKTNDAGWRCVKFHLIDIKSAKLLCKSEQHYLRKNFRRAILNSSVDFIVFVRDNRTRRVAEAERDGKTLNLYPQINGVYERFDQTRFESAGGYDGSRHDT